MSETFKKGGIKMIFRKKMKREKERGSLKIEYEYSDPQLSYQGIASSATVKTENGRIIAKAKLVDLISDENNNFKGIVIREEHFNFEGKVVFSCNTVFTSPLGERSEETNVNGVKPFECFEQWPMSRW